MAIGKIKRSDIYSKDLFGELVKSAQAANEILDDQSRAIEKLAGEYKKLGVQSSADVKKILLSEKKVKAAIEANIKVQRAKLAIDTAIKKAISQNTKAKKEGLVVAQQALKVDEQKQKVALAEKRVKGQQIANEIKLTKEKERLNKAATKEAAALKASKTAYMKLTSSTNAARLKYKELAAEFGHTDKRTKAAAKSFDVLDRKLRKINEGAKDGRRDVGRYGTAFGKLGSFIKGGLATAGITAGLALLKKGFVAAINVFKGFEHALSGLKAVSQATDAEMKRMSDQAKALGSSTAYTATQVVELQTEYSKLGFPISDIEQMTESTLNAAAAMKSGLAETAALTGSTLKAFNLDASQAGRVNDVLARSTSASALDFAKLSTAMSTVAPVANAMGFSVEGTTALLGQLSNAGFDASSSATATRNILLNLADANGDLAKSLGGPVKDLPGLVAGLKKLQATGVDLAGALELTDKRSVAAFSTFLAGADDVLVLNDKLEMAGGTAQRMADTQLDNLAGKITILGSAWEGFILSLEDGNGVFGSLLKNIVQETTALLGFFTATDTAKSSIIETGRATAEFVTTGRSLVTTYTDLANKTNLTTEEKRKLNNVTTDLISRFGDSVVEIDKETGAFKLNTQEIIRQLQVKSALDSEAVRNLLGEKLRLEVLREKAQQAREEFDMLRSSFANKDSSPFPEYTKELSGYIGALKMGYSEQEALSLAFTGDMYSRFVPDELPIGPQKSIEKLNELNVEGLDLYSGSIGEIKQQLLDLGIDLDDIATKSAGVSLGGKGAGPGPIKALGLLAKVDEEIAAKRKSQYAATNVVLVQSIGVEIEALESKRKRILGIEEEIADKTDEIAQENKRLAIQRADFINQIEQEGFNGRIAMLEREKSEIAENFKGNVEMAEENINDEKGRPDSRSLWRAKPPRKSN
jgi:TP901 family phage tail tape measure protein